MQSLSSSPGTTPDSDNNHGINAKAVAQWASQQRQEVLLTWFETYQLALATNQQANQLNWHVLQHLFQQPLVSLDALVFTLKNIEDVASNNHLLQVVGGVLRDCLLEGGHCPGHTLDHKPPAFQALTGCTVDLHTGALGHAPELYGQQVLQAVSCYAQPVFVVDDGRAPLDEIKALLDDVLPA